MMFCRLILRNVSYKEIQLNWDGEEGVQEEVRMEAVTDPMKYFCRAKSLLIAEVV